MHIRACNNPSMSHGGDDELAVRSLLREAASHTEHLRIGLAARPSEQLVEL
jgi:hypothetical protein